MYQGHPYKGLFVSFEGPDGSGKSTQFLRLGRYLRENGLTDEMIVETREPGGTAIGEQIRNVLLSRGSEEIDPYAELLLFEASRAQLVAKRIKPALLEGKLVLADRFFDSSTTYQGVAGKVPLDLVMCANQLASQRMNPDRTYLFDVSYEVAQTRMGGGRRITPPGTTMSGRPVEVRTTLFGHEGQEDGPDRIESKERGYRELLRQGYLGLAHLEPERFKVINTDNKDPDQIFAEMLTDFTALCKEKGYPLRTPES